MNNMSNNLSFNKADVIVKKGIKGFKVVINNNKSVMVEEIILNSTYTILIPNRRGFVIETMSPDHIYWLSFKNETLYIERRWKKNVWKNKNKSKNNEK